MSEYDEEIPDEDKVKIASDFILHAPPGEFNEVFNDVRVLLANDNLLKEGASAAFAKYNEEQFTPAKIPDTVDEALITEHALVDGNTYLDPRSKQTFTFDHLRKEASDVTQIEPEGDEATRAAFDTAVKEYTDSHYPKGVSSIYSKGDNIIACIEDHKFQPNNYWNGRWRSEWTVNTSSGQIDAVLKVQVHYYEAGNVQLNSQKQVSANIPVGDAAAMTEKFVKIVRTAESEYQTAISENYNTMSDTTFKALRRALPITRTKVDWNKILNYRIGKELKN